MIFLASLLAVVILLWAVTLGVGTLVWDRQLRAERKRYDDLLNRLWVRPEGDGQAVGLVAMPYESPTSGTWLTDDSGLVIEQVE